MPIVQLLPQRIVACFFQTVICKGLNWCRVKDPAARGIAIGISTGALGVARRKAKSHCRHSSAAAQMVITIRIRSSCPCSPPFLVARIEGEI